MLISINSNVQKGPYGGGNQMLVAFEKHLTSHGHSVHNKILPETEAIYIWQSNPSSYTFGFQEIQCHIKNHNCQVIHRINDNGLHRGDASQRDEWFKKLNILSDRTIFISEWVKDYYEKFGIKGEVIHNGVDRSLFKPSNNTRGESSPLKIVTHHWSDNKSKGYDIYQKIDEFCVRNPNIAKFRFIGRDKCFNLFSNNCEKISAIPYNEIPPYLSDEDVYVSASLHEAGGCHLIEGMACGLIPFARVGGGGTECYMGDFGEKYVDGQGLIDKIIHLYNNYEKYSSLKNRIISEYTYSSEQMCEKYLGLLG